MCGIVGYLTTEEGKLATSRSRYLSQGLIVDMLRGADSTGAFFVPHELAQGQNAGWCRDITDGYTFVSTNKYYDDFAGVGDEHFAAIGHNRSATIGGINMAAAHPFAEEPITLVHNGTLRGTHGLPITQHEAKAANDSHTIALNLKDTPIWELAPKMNGSFALIWHDSRDNTVNILREHDRPLHIAKIKGQDSLFIASEAEMLYWLTSRLRLTIEDLATPKPGDWLKFEHGNLVPTITPVELYQDYWSKSKSRSNRRRKNATMDWEKNVEDADWEPVNPVSRQALGKKPLPGTGTIGDNNVKLLGRKRPIPEICQEDLLEHNLLTEHRLVFVPNTCAGLPERPALVSGYLEAFNGMTGMVYGVPAGMIKNGAMDRRWVVRPIAVKVLDDKEVAIVCKLCKTNVHDATATAILSNSPPIAHDSSMAPVEATIEEVEDSPFVPTEGVKGPSGGQVTPTYFMNSVAGGCIQCSGTIELCDADDTVWVNEGVDPMCPTCVREYFDNLKEDENAS